MAKRTQLALLIDKKWDKKLHKSQTTKIHVPNVKHFFIKCSFWASCLSKIMKNEL